MRPRNRFLRISLVAAILIAVLVVGAFLAMRSGIAASQAAAAIEEATGAPVRVGSLDLGFTGSSLRNLEFFEEGGPAAAPPWVVVPEVQADLPLTRLARGQLAGGTITLRNPHITLRLDRDDNILTKLPSPEGDGGEWPVFRLEGGRITLLREGRSDTVITGLKAELRKEGSRIVLSGSADDPDWGRWALRGGRDSDNASFALVLHCDRFRATMDKLHRVPFVPPTTWEHVQLEGDTPVDITLDFGGQESALRYRVTLAPTDTTVHVGAIDLNARQAAGRVIVEDGVVKLCNVHGRTAGGDLRCDATLDFTGTGSAFLFNVRADQLALKELPENWGLPKWDGRLSGQAQMEVTVADGQVRTTGQGRGTVQGFLGAEPLQVRMTADGHKYRFDITNTTGTRNPPPVATGLLAAFLATLQPPPAPAQPAAPAQPQDLEINLGLRDVDLAELVRRVQIVLPFRLEGKLSFRVQAAVPVRDAGNPKAYRFNGTVSLPWARIEDLLLREVRARVVYTDGVLRLEELSARVPDAPPGTGPPTGPVTGGSVAGKAELGLVPAGDLTAQLRVAELPVGQLLRAIPDVAAEGGGTIEGDVSLRAPAGALREVNRWEANGRLIGRKVRAFGRAAEELEVRARLRDGTLTVAEARGRLNGAAVSGTGELRLADPYRYQARLELPPSELRAWQEVVPEVRPLRLAGQARANADLRGTLRPLVVEASGTAQVEGLEVNDLRVGAVQTRWDADTDRLHLVDFAAKLDAGELTGSATLPFRPSVPGKVELRLNRFNAGKLVKGLPPSAPRLGRLDDILASALGAADGTVMVNLPPAPAGRGRESTVEYQITGEALGGKFELNGRGPLYSADPPSQPPSEPRPPGAPGKLSLRGADLSRLADALRIDALRPLSGRLDLTVEYRHDGPGWEPVGTGRVVVANLRWGGQPVTDQFGSEIRLEPAVLSVQELSGRLGGGNLRARLTYDYRRPQRRFLQLTLERGDARTLLAPFTDTSVLDGPVDVRLFTRLGSEWSGSGQVTMTRGKLFGVTVRDATFPLGWAFAPGGPGELRLRDAAAQASRGRLTARATLAWGGETRLDGQTRFSGVDLGEFLSQYTDTRVAGGLASGRIDFGGRDLRSANDLTASVDASLAETTAFQVPVLRQVAPVILPGVGANALFHSGELRGRLAGGVFRIERLTLVGELARVFVEGTVTLQQRLNLDVTANTNQLGLDPAALRLLGLSLPAFGPIPLGLLNQASGYLSNVTIRLRVSGTIRAPSIQVRPVQLLSDAAVRFFLGQFGVPASLSGRLINPMP